ncbi:MAG: hypothetical protein J5684_06310 [Eubacterium sp.]|nr:hypothetical protein [Eubacterium sp.]
MPHSGGGGSHGGGSHGGSHGGSSHRTSSHYFPGSKRYRRHYYDGREDEYFYSNAAPRKSGLSGILFILVFGGFFIFAMLFSTFNSAPKKLEENYTRPSSRIIDNIDIIDNDSELEDALEEYNDITGICPVVYTMYVEDYIDDCSDLETFAYEEYIREFSDERHYLLVYAIPENQLEGYVSGEIKVPDFVWESMIGDDTDALYNENTFVKQVQSGLDAGLNPGEVFADAIRDMSKYDSQRLSRKWYTNLSALTPVIFVSLFFVIPIIFMVKNYKKEKEFEYEEVPFTDEDSPIAAAYANPTLTNSATKAGSIVSAVVISIFALVGIGLVIGGLKSFKGGDRTGLLMMGFGAVWTILICKPLVQTLKNFSKKSDDDDDDYRSYDD